MLNNLIIIGNGFDLAHRLTASYNCFRQYLIEKYCIDEDDFCYEVPEGTMMPDGGVEHSHEEVAQFVYELFHDIKGADWSDFETMLGLTDFSTYFDNDFLDAMDKEGDFNP